MKINGYDITLKNVWAYIQGNSRLIAENLGSDIFKSPQHIQEQIIWREVIHNPECYRLGKCIHCKCAVPDKLYADKECEGGCYPVIMNEYTWDKFKQLCARRKIDIFHDKFDWDVIMSDIESMDDSVFNSLIDDDKAGVDMGDIKRSTKFQHTFELFNPESDMLIINTINPSCGCCQVVNPKTIEPNSYGNLTCNFDPSGLKLGKHEVWITVRYNEIKRINLKVTYNLI
jgi:hypothetical protein